MSDESITIDGYGTILKSLTQKADGTTEVTVTEAQSFEEGTLVVLNQVDEETVTETTINASATENRTLVLPDKDGTLATLDDVGGSFDESALRDVLDNLGGTLYLNYQRLNSVGHPHPNAWPHGTVTVEWAKQRFLQNRLVTLGISGDTLNLSQVSPWQGIAAIDQNGISAFNLPTSPEVGDIVDCWIARGGPCGMIDAGAGGNILSWGQVFPVASNTAVRLTCTDTNGPVWSVEDRNYDQWIDACNSAAVGLAIQAGGLAAQSVSALASARTVVWRPFAEGPGEGYVETWAEAVAAVNLVDGPTTIQIVGVPDEDTVTIPGGTWDLNQTTLVGVARDADTDTDYRGYQDLLYIVTEGSNTNPCWIRGCVGLKDMFFRASDYADSDINGSDGTFSALADGIMTFTKTGGYEFSAKDVGKPIRIGTISPYNTFGSDTDVADNRGTFLITNVVDADTIQYENFSGGATTDDANNGSIGWSLCTSVFTVTNLNELQDSQFILDNTDFRFGGDYNWGSFFIAGGTSVFFKLKNAASLRWFSAIVDGYLVIQSDGGGSWVGSNAFCGNGNVDVFPMPGTQVRRWQPSIASWTLHEPYIVYLPNDEDHWPEDVPESLHEAVDLLARRTQQTTYRLAPGAAGETEVISASSTPAVFMDTSGVGSGTVTTHLSNGDYDGQEVIFLGGPWTDGVAWDVIPYQSAVGTITLAGNSSVSLKWVSITSLWYVTSSFGNIAIP